MTGHYLLFNGNCKDALAVYEKAFGVKVAEMRTYGDMPPSPAFPVAESQKNLVLHAKFFLGGAEIMCADASERAGNGENMYVSITEKDAVAVQKAWDCLKDGAKIYMELQPSFFAEKHGSLRDKFGINWMFTALKA
jgi:PhnB protein